MNGGFLVLDDSWIGKTVLFGDTVYTKNCNCPKCDSISCKTGTLNLIPAKITKIWNMQGNLSMESILNLELEREKF